jgi:hypothetical protein
MFQRSWSLVVSGLMATAIRLLKRAGAVDEQLVAEVKRIEHNLGALEPTA